MKTNSEHCLRKSGLLNFTKSLYNTVTAAYIWWQFLLLIIIATNPKTNLCTIQFSNRLNVEVILNNQLIVGLIWNGAQTNHISGSIEIVTFFPLMGHNDDYLIYRSIILLFEIYCWIPCWRLVFIPFQIHKKNHPFLKLLVDFLWQTLAKPCWPRSKKFAWPTKGFSCFLHHHFITSSWLFFYYRTRELCKQNQNLLTTTAKKVAFSPHVARVLFSARGGEVLSSLYFNLISYSYSLISCWWLLIIIL